MKVPDIGFVLKGIGIVVLMLIPGCLFLKRPFYLMITRFLLLIFGEDSVCWSGHCSSSLLMIP